MNTIIILKILVSKSFFLGKKLEDGKGIGGKGRLTLTGIDTLQNFFGKAIRDNKRNARAMSKATHAILKHSSTPEQPRHEDCPWGRIHGVARAEIKQLVRPLLYQSRIPY